MTPPKKGPGNSVFDPFSGFIYECLRLRMSLAAIWRELMKGGPNRPPCPYRKYKTFWQWIDIRSRPGYKPRRTFEKLGEKLTAPVAAPVQPIAPQFIPKTSQAAAAATLKALKERKSDEIDFVALFKSPTKKTSQ